MPILVLVMKTKAIGLAHAWKLVLDLQKMGIILVQGVETKHSDRKLDLHS